MRYLSCVLLVLVCVLGLAAPVQAQFQQGDVDLTLTGGGASDKSLQNTSFTATAGLGYFLTNEVELGLRQSVSYTSNWDGATSVFADYNFSQFGKLVPFVGVSIGHAYGPDVVNHWFGGPEAGLRLFLNKSSYIYGSAEYQFDINQGINAAGFIYTVGIGLKF